MKNFSPMMALMPGIIGLAALLNNINKPRVAALHGPELLVLVAAGFGFGATFALLWTWYLRRKERRAAE